MSHNIIIGIVVLLIVLSIILQIMIGVLYQNMINETDNMTATDNQLLKQCKTRFANCYRMNGGVANIPIFIDKFINHLKIGKVSLIAMQHWSGQLVLFSVFVSGMGIYTGITRGDRFITLMPYYIISLIGLYVYFGVSSAVDIAGKRRLLKTNLVDYMENHMVKRLELLPESIRMADMTEEELGTVRRKRHVQETLVSETFMQEDSASEKDKHADGNYENEIDAVHTKRTNKDSATDKNAGRKKTQNAAELQDDEELELLLREFLS